MWRRSKNEIKEEVRIYFMREIYGNRKKIWFGLIENVVEWVVIYVKKEEWKFMGFEGIFNFVELGRIYEMKKLDKEKLKEI